MYFSTTKKVGDLDEDLWLVFVGKHRKLYAEILVLFNTEWFALKKELGIKVFIRILETQK